MTAAEALVERYASYLRERRGLAPSTVRNYVGVARVFLCWREATAGGLELERLDAAAVSEFVLERGAALVCGLGEVHGHPAAGVVAVPARGGRDRARRSPDAVPSVAGWRLAGLVKALDARSVARLLASCDRRTRVGRRDFAIITLLSRLGLRAGEVAALQLADIDWRAGELLVRGKGSRHERLPLPADVGEALAGWLERGRPRRDSPFVFTRLRAPLCRPDGRCCLADRAPRLPAGRGCRSVGAHRLRHTAATEMLRAGGSLTEVGQVLRHRGRDVTSIYAKVDRLALVAGRSAVAGSAGMTTLAEHAKNYLTVRRALGFKLVGEGELLAEFVACAEAAGQRTITTEFALQWARRPANGSHELSVAAAAGGPHVRPVSARARPRLRGPAARAAARQEVPAGAIPLSRRGDRRVDGRRPARCARRCAPRRSGR